MPVADLIEKVVRSRIARISLAAILILISIWAFSPYVGFRVSSSAFVNAELMRVTAPIPGRLTDELPHRGEFIARKQAIELITSIAPDQRHLFDLREQQETAEARAELARKQIDEIDASEHMLSDRVATYRAGMVRRIDSEIKESVAERDGCRAEANERRDASSRMKQLVEKGLASRIRSAEMGATEEATATRCAMADARLKRLKDELSLAREGIFLRDGMNDAPYSQQQRDRLALRRQDLQSELLNQSSRAKLLSSAIGAEKRRLAEEGKFEVSLPAGFVVWSTAASPGSAVIAGQRVMDLADCRHRFVTVELPGREFEQIRPGDRAAIRLVGGDTWTFGYVRHQRGSAAYADNRLLAARLPKPSSGSTTVEVDLPQNAWPGDRVKNFCNIGRLAEVRFSRIGFSYLNLFDRIFGHAEPGSR